MRRLLLAAVPLALLAVPAHAADHGVDVRDNSFSPTTATVRVGDRVVWTHRGQVLHTVTADDGSFDSRNMLPGTTFTHTFTTPGTVPYHCNIHASMRGTVVVQSASATTTTRPPSTTSTTGRTTTTLPPGESAVTAPRDRTTTTTTTTLPGETTTTTTIPGETTTTTEEDLAASARVEGNDDDEASHAGPTALAALLLAGVAGSTALALKRGL